MTAAKRSASMRRLGRIALVDRGDRIPRRADHSRVLKYKVLLAANEPCTPRWRVRVELTRKFGGCRHACFGRCARLKCHFAEIECAAFVHELEVIGALRDVSCSLDRHRERTSATPNAGPADIGDCPKPLHRVSGKPATRLLNPLAPLRAAWRFGGALDRPTPVAHDSFFACAAHSWAGIQNRCTMVSARGTISNSPVNTFRCASGLMMRHSTTP